MRDESYGFENTKVRLEEIVSQVRKKDVSLEKSLDLLEEGVRLANQCTELIDKADWQEAGVPSGENSDEAEHSGEVSEPEAVDASADEPVALQTEDGGDVAEEESAS